jgi:hypothetical protein
VHGPGKFLTIGVFFESSSSSVSATWIHLEGVFGSAEVIPWVLVVVYRVCAAVVDLLLGPPRHEVGCSDARQLICPRRVLGWEDTDEKVWGVLIWAVWGSGGCLLSR